MRLSEALAATVLLTAACHDHMDLGSKPHLLGKLANVKLGMAEAEMKSLVPELDEPSDDSGPTSIEYAANFDRKHHLEDVIVRVAQPIDDLLAAWGPGDPGTYALGPARIYADAANGIRYAVILDSAAPTGNSFIVIATPMRALATIFDDGPDVKVFGIDAVGSALVVDVSATANPRRTRSPGNRDRAVGGRSRLGQVPPLRASRVGHTLEH